MGDLLTSRERFAAAGVSTLPVHPGSKVPVCTSWQESGSAEQWQIADRGLWNIGVRCGDGLAAADCDNLAAASFAGAVLAGLGVRPVVVKTPSPEGWHFWVKVAGAPSAVGAAALAVGAGHFAWSRRFCLAPESVFDGVLYRFEAGGVVEDFARLPVLDFGDLAALVKPVVAAVSTSLPPLRLLKRGMSRRVTGLLAELAAGKAHPGGFLSRSEAEESVLTGLILSGWSFDEVRAVFEEVAPGHFAEHARQDDYLGLSWRRALAELCADPVRQQVAELDAAVCGMSWPGRGGLLDAAVLRALLASCWVAGSLDVNAAERDLALHACASRIGVHSALKRLRGAALIELVAPGDRRLCMGARWRVADWHSDVAINDHASQFSRVVVYRHMESGDAELWGQSRLGRSCHAVYDALTGDGLTVGDLVVVTGKARRTVGDSLAKLRSHGLADVCGVRGRSWLWVRGDADAAAVARELDCAAAADKRLVRVTDERNRHRERLAKGVKRGG